MFERVLPLKRFFSNFYKNPFDAVKRSFCNKSISKFEFSSKSFQNKISRIFKRPHSQSSESECGNPGHPCGDKKLSKFARIFIFYSSFVIFILFRSRRDDAARWLYPKRVGRSFYDVMEFPSRKIPENRRRLDRAIRGV